MLEKTHPGLPAHWYYEPEHFQREMRAIFQQQWICIGRTSDWPETGSYQVVTLGDQNILVVRADNNSLNAFHNTCRHRGSRLCEAASGQLTQQRIVCPYHAWTYDLEGNLQRTPRRVESADFDPAQFPLYRVALESWGGFVFINLADPVGRSLIDSLGAEAAALQNWPLAELQLAHREQHPVACNWKIFWENYLECYHCPGIHPGLCRLVPVYAQGFLGNADLAALGQQVTTKDGHMLRDLAQTWTESGVSGLPLIEGLSEAEQIRGMTFATFIPTMFVVAHRDYVRSVRVTPLTPETTLLTVDWLLPTTSMDAPAEQIESVIAFARQVVTEDARACELNQQGLKSIRHQQGVLMPQEYDVLAFNNWLRQSLMTAP
ncbi:MAG TPA: aromatic ring-hydroxylating dioxygenase subunit alpha [Xanthomonadales bacterium]|nr:aromatic ring-hydroxylating dioxygenase subunit alpha [Xanthomonadales bacterium]